MNEPGGDNLERGALQGGKEAGVAVPSEEKAPRTQDDTNAEVNILPKIERAGGEINPEIQKDTSRSAVQTATQDDSVQAASLPNDDDDSSKTVPAKVKDLGDSPATADDIDLIEKEWVEKAKQIVEQTKNNPREQNIALGKMKADYLKKRFNKVIKTEKGT
jgi:hypothetical protein